MSKKDEFLLYAEQQCGKKGTDFWSSVGSPKNMPWSCSFITSCAKKVGINNQVLPHTTNSNSYVKKGTNDIASPGKFFKGKALSGMNLPKDGDIILLGSDVDNVDKVGIVKSYNPNTATMNVIIGDSAKSGHNRSEVTMIQLDPTYNEIVGYFRPDWESAE